MSVTLADLRVGERARVAGFAGQSAYSDQLVRIGLTPGTALVLQRRAPLGDPVEIRFRGYSLILRPSEATDLLLERE